jgi:molybdenum cofactor biosynthesis protein B
MADQTDARRFIPLNIAVLTVSDTRRPEDDRSGDTLTQRLTEAGHSLAARSIVPDEIPAIRERVEAWLRDPGVDVVITTGGTGFTGRDVTPEALEPLFEKRMDGFSAVFHRISYDKIGTSTLQSRATAGGRAGDLRVRAAGLARRLPRRLGRDPGPAARLPAPALQLRRDHAAPRRAPAARREPHRVRRR